MRHMLPVEAEDMYPQWSDSEINFDPKVDKLLHDIISDQLVPGCWDEPEKVPSKRHLAFDDQTSQKVSKKQKEQNNVDGNVLDVLMEIAEKMTKMEQKHANFDVFAHSVKADLNNLREVVEEQARQGKHVEGTVSSSNNKVVEEEDDGATSKKSATVNTPAVTSCETPANDNPLSVAIVEPPVDVTPVVVEIVNKPGSGPRAVRTPVVLPVQLDTSWMLQETVNASDGLPVRKVVKSATQVGRTGEGVAESDESLVDITEQEKNKKDDLEMASSSGARTLSAPVLKRVPNSTVKRIILVVNYEHDYDPMLPVDEVK